MHTTHLTIRRLTFVFLSLMLLPLLAPTAWADDIFSCGVPNACGGTVTQSGSTYSSSVTDILTNAPGEASDTFTFSFSLTPGSSVGTATLSDGSDTFTATNITSVTVSTGSSGQTTDISFGADWTGSGPDFGGTNATDSGTVVFSVSNGQVTGVTVDLVPGSDPISAPEPSTGLLLATGFLGLGGLLVRKHTSPA